jgi:hypothetical protein
MRWLVVVAVVGALVGPVHGAVVGGFALLGLDDVTVGPGARVDAGDVGANRGTVTLRRGARVAAGVVADTVRIAPGASAASLRCRLLLGRARFACEALAGPVVDVTVLPLVQVLPGAAGVRVPRGGRAAPLAAGAYADVRVGSHAVLVLAGGDYAVRRITLAPRAQLACAAPCRIAVQDRVLLRPRAVLGPAAGVAPTAVRVDVEGHGGLRARAHARVRADVYAPAGDVALGRARHAATVVARRIVVGAGARVVAEPAP